MVLPVNVNTITVTGTYMDMSGTPLVGTVTFRPAPEILRDPDANVLISDFPFVVTLDVDGSFSIDLPATDDPDLVPSPWYYVVSENMNDHRRQWFLEVPLSSPGGTLDLADVDRSVRVPSVITYASRTELLAHLTDTTDVHGIANTVNLETKSGAQSKADAAQSAATSAAAVSAASLYARRTYLKINAKDYGALGDNLADDTAELQAAIDAAAIVGVPTRVSADPSIAYDHMGVDVLLPPGVYVINSPLLLPRTSQYRSRTVGLVGESMAATQIKAGPSFPSGRGLIEWAPGPDIDHNNARDHRIRNMTLRPKLEAGAMAIYFELMQARDSYGTAVNDIDTLYNCDFEDLIIFGDNTYHDSLIRLEGRVDFCKFRNITADNTLGTAAVATKLLHFDDFSLWPLLAAGSPTLRHSDSPGLNGSIVSQTWSGHRGGLVSALWGRVGGSVLEQMFANGAVGTTPCFYIRDGGNLSIRGLGTEGRAEVGIFTFENCSGVTMNDFGIGITDEATVLNPGVGLKLVNCRSMEFSNRYVQPTTVAQSAENSVLVSVDANCRDIKLGRIVSTASFELEMSIDAAAQNIELDYLNITDGKRTFWGPPIPTAHQMRSGYYVVPVGSRTTIAMIASQEWATPIQIGKDCTLDRIAVEVTTAGTAGTVIRLGIRDDDNGTPGKLMLDAGTVAGDAVANAELTISQRIQRPGVYWLTATPQSTGAGLPSIRAIGSNTSPTGSPSLAGAMSATPTAGYTTSGSVSGALPSTYTVSTRIGAAPLIAVRGT